MIQCSKCKQIKEECEFSPRKHRIKLYHSLCKSCNSKASAESTKRTGRAKKNYEKNKLNPLWVENTKIQAKQRHINNRERYLLTTCKARAKKKGLEFNLSIEDIVIPDKCPILGTTFPKGSAQMHLKNWYSSSIDRIDNSKGYIKGNIMIISRKANVMKNSASKEELIAFSKYYLKEFSEEI